MEYRWVIERRWQLRRMYKFDDLSGRVWKTGGMMLTGENRSTLEDEPIKVPLCPPQIPRGLACSFKRASAVRGRLLTA
jgi:hypothetical protein